MITMRQTTRSHTDKRVYNRPEDEWVKTPNSHPAIISQELFETVQRLKENGRRRFYRGNKRHEPRPLDSISFCADCGRRMHSRRSNGNATPVYNCGKHIQGKMRTNVGTCTSHHIQKKHLEEYVLDYLRRILLFAKDHELEFMEQVKMQTLSQLETDSISMQKELRQANERLSEIDNTLKILYADRLSGTLSPALFAQFSTEHEAEQNVLAEKISKIQAQIQAAKEQSTRPQRFLNLVRRFTDAKELTPELVSALISRVEVGELKFDGTDKRKKRSQSITIVLNIIGNLTIT
jgi:outer membrane murein-binding lipoprotein Lpp